MRPIFLAAICFLSCSSLAVEKYELGEMNIDAGFLILFDSRGSAMKASDAFAIHQGEVTFGELPHFNVDRDQSVALLSIDSAKIAASARLFDESKLADACVVIEPGPEKPQPADGGRERIAIPAETKVFMLRDGAIETFDGDRAALLAGLSLVVVLDPDKCQIPNLPPLSAFTRDQFLRVPPQYDVDTYRNFVGMKIIDDETALALTDYTVLLAKKGRRWELMPAGTSTAGSVLFREVLQPPDGTDLRVYGLDIDRVQRPDGTYRVIAVAADSLLMPRPLPESSTFGLIYELAVSGEAIERVETIGRVDYGLIAVAMGPDGTAGLVGTNGHFLIVDRNRQITELPPVVENMPYAPQSVTWTKDQDRPWMVGALGHIYVYDARSESWDTWVIPLTTVHNRPGGSSEDPIEVESLAAARTPAGELELWAGGSGGVLFRRVGDGPWEIIDPVMPPSFEHCSIGGAYPELDFDGHFDAIAIYGSHLLATLRDCSAIMELRRDDLCIALLSEEGNAIEAQLNRDVQTMDVLGEQIVVGGEGALIMATEP